MLSRGSPSPRKSPRAAPTPSHPRQLLRKRVRRAENTAQAACLDHRQPSDPGRRPKPSFLLLTTSLLSPSPFSLFPIRIPLLPARRLRPHHYSPTPPSLPPSSAFGLVRQEKSSATRRRRVSTRATVACTRRYASSSTFVTSPYVPLFPSPPPPCGPLATPPLPLFPHQTSFVVPTTSSLVRVSPHFGTQLPLVVEKFSRVLPNPLDPSTSPDPPPPSPNSYTRPSISSQTPGISTFFFAIGSPPLSAAEDSKKQGGSGSLPRKGERESGNAGCRRARGRAAYVRVRPLPAYSSRDFHDLRRSTSKRSGKGDEG